MSTDGDQSKVTYLPLRAILWNHPGLDGRWVSLPPVEARLMGALLDRFGAVVSREQLAKAGWPRGAPGRNALDVHMLRLRRRISPIGLAIKTVRSRGYLLEAEAAVPQPAANLA